MPKYKVTLLETLMRHAECVVEAPNEKKARDLALKLASTGPRADVRRVGEQLLEQDVWTVEETK